jgi:hypothetical protein
MLFPAKTVGVHLYGFNPMHPITKVREEECLIMGRKPVMA